MLIAPENFDRRFAASDETMGDWSQALGMIGASAVQLLPGLFGSSSGGAIKGTNATKAFGESVIQSLTRLREQMQLGLVPPATAAAEAVRIEGMLSNSQIIYQAKTGSDAAALNSAKQAAKQLVTQIQTEAAQLSAGQQNSPTPATQTAGMDKNVLLGLGLAGLVVFLLVK
jgi:hypothetical protein